MLPPTAAAAAALAAPVAALRLLPPLAACVGLPAGAAVAARTHAWLAEALLVGACVAAVRARAALKRWVAQVHAERCASPLISTLT